MILNVEPGGPVVEYAVPASASTSPVPGWMTAIPPLWPASALIAASSIFGLIVVRTGGAGRGRERASTRPPTDSVPPGRPASCG